MHHFVVKFLKNSSPQAASGHSPPNQNPADALGQDYVRQACAAAVDYQAPTRVAATPGEACVPRSGRASAAATTPPTPSPSTSAPPSTS